MTDKIYVNEQNSIRIEAEKIIYVDPFKIVNEAHDADIIMFTHSHHDHFSPEDYKKVAKDGTVFVSPKSMADEALASGIEKDKLITLNPGDACEVLGIPVEGVASYNVGKPMHTKEKGWLGYVITANETRIYICGDMDANEDGKKVKCDIVMLPIGGFYTMDAKEAAEFVNELKPKIAIPTHYGTLIGKPADAKVFKDLVDDGIEVCFKLASE